MSATTEKDQDDDSPDTLAAVERANAAATSANEVADRVLRLAEMRADAAVSPGA